LNAAAEETSILIGYSCEALNNFYTRQEARLESQKPTTGVADEVAGALANTLGEPGWVKFVDAVMTADPSVWKKLKNFRCRHRRGGTFALTHQASLVLSTATEPSLERADDSVTLNIPL
jgi:hypothetical protein